MGYTTTFEGIFEFSKPLTKEQKNYLKKFAGSRRMKRDPTKLPNSKVNDAARVAMGLPIGPEGEYVVNDDGNFGQTEDESIVSYNNPPSSQPGSWCKWTPNHDGTGLEWSNREKFYEYVEWLEYLIEKFFVPWGVVLNGRVEYRGEHNYDKGLIIVDDNKVAKIPFDDIRRMKIWQRFLNKHPSIGPSESVK